MAFCDQCGKEIRDGAKYCDGCGAVTGGVAPAQARADVPHAAEGKTVHQKRGFKSLMIIGAAVIVVMVCGALFWRHLPGLNTIFSKGGQGENIKETGDNQSHQAEAAAKAKVPDGYAYIPPGEFKMGCSPEDDECRDEEIPAHRVRITKGFYMKVTEVKQGDYRSVMGENPSHFTNCGDLCPVEMVTWQNARDYCKKTGGRLPTEAEWEYAARAGASTKYYWGDSVDGDYAWYDDNSDNTTHPVGQKKPNAYGLHDMLGNVWEWVEDCYDKDWYDKTQVANPLNTSTGCGYRVLRGGSWSGFAGPIRMSYRRWSFPGFWYGISGFRCVLDY